MHTSGIFLFTVAGRCKNPRHTDTGSLVMNRPGYEIRCGILQEARNMLTEQYHAKQDNENTRAAHEDRAPELIPSPTVQEIKALAEELWDWL